MTNEAPARLSETLMRLARESSRRGSGLHRQFLAQRGASLEGVKSLIALQIRSAGALPAEQVERPCLFTGAQLDAFGTGKVSDCFGPSFACYDQRRVARMPNGDLKMMSRVVAISGKPRDFTVPSSIAVEYDVPDESWYMRDQAGPHLPYSLVMEIALQPCGFLIAYLDSFAVLPEGEYNFRNLDGWMEIDERYPAGGRRILTQARMLSSVISGGVLMQKFAFTLTCDGRPLCHGETLFGYFPTAVMAAQVGLDGGKATRPWVDAHPEGGQWVDLDRWLEVQPSRPGYRLSGGQLELLDRIWTRADGGQYGKGYMYASRDLSPDEWFYRFHFYQDPVMPGSLGVEAILQGVRAWALENGLGAKMRSPAFGLAEAVRTQWRYRGQILQAHRKMELEIHLSSVQADAHGMTVTGDANLWIDGLRIYEVKNAAIGVLEA